MRAGQLRQRVALIALTHEETENGELIPTETVTNISAKVEDVSGGEQYRRFAVNAEATTLVEMRWRSDVQPGSAMRYGNRTLNVISVIDKDGRKRHLIAQCKDVRAARG